MFMKFSFCFYVFYIVVPLEVEYSLIFILSGLCMNGVECSFVRLSWSCAAA